MPRRPRLAAGDLAYHTLNRRIERLPLFDKPADYAAFEKLLAEAHARQASRDSGVLTSIGLAVKIWRASA